MCLGTTPWTRSLLHTASNRLRPGQLYHGIQFSVSGHLTVLLGRIQTCFTLLPYASSLLEDTYSTVCSAKHIASAEWLGGSRHASRTTVALMFCKLISRCSMQAGVLVFWALAHCHEAHRKNTQPSRYTNSAISSCHLFGF